MESDIVALALVVNRRNGTTHMLAPEGDRSLCGRLVNFKVDDIQNDAEPDDVICLKCYEIMWGDPKYFP